MIMKKQIKGAIRYIKVAVLSVLTVVSLISCQKDENYDVIVYGATPAGIMAAVTAADQGASVLLLEPTKVIGGMYSSGLNTAESEHMLNDVITGRARDFYIRLGEEYYDSAYFTTFGNGRGLKWSEGDPAFFFESKHATALFNDMVGEAGIDLIREVHLIAADKAGTEIRSIQLSNGQTFQGKYFVDCSYEGDLMAEAGVSYTYGRESIEAYNESLAGVRLIDDTLNGRTVGENGELLKSFNRYDTIIPGRGDKRVMNYNFRPLMSQDPDNMVPVTRPDQYDSTQFDFLADYLAEHPKTRLGNLVGKYPRGSGKFEFNNQQKSLISLGMFGANTGYTEGDQDTREEIYNDHKQWTLGFLYFLGHDPRVPEHLRKETRSYGFAADEFTNNENFPVYLYVREGRRMIGALVQTQHDVYRDREKEDAVMLGSHWIDSHHVQRIAINDTSFVNEGRIWEMVVKPFEISYQTQVPKKDECTNLIVPVCSSFSHVGFCAYRLESTWMQAGHVAGVAAAMALKNDLAVQDVNITTLQNTLISEGMVIDNDAITEFDDYRDIANREKFERFTRMYSEYGLDMEM